MSLLENKINEINLLLDKVANMLDGLNDASFDEDLKSIMAKIITINNIKIELKKSAEPNILEVYKSELNIKAKLINEKFDNIIREKAGESQVILSHINKMSNQRKLTNYIR